MIENLILALAGHRYGSFILHMGILRVGYVMGNLEFGFYINILIKITKHDLK